MYSIFSGATYFAHSLWQVGATRFLVAMGVGGEWAVAASLVAEVFPKEARAHASGIFHAIQRLRHLGRRLGGHGDRRPMALWIPDWHRAGLAGVLGRRLDQGTRELAGSWSQSRRLRRSQNGKLSLICWAIPAGVAAPCSGLLLAAVGLGSFWGVTVAGQDLAKELLVRNGVAPGQATQQAKFAYGIVQTIGGGLGLLAMGPLCVRLGRRRAFALMHAGAFLIVPITCYLPSTYGQLLVLLPVFGFLTLGIHAGYAIYFPELFPTHLRASGSGFCFNGGRIVAASALVLSGWLKSLPGHGSAPGDYLARLCSFPWAW